MKIKFVIVILSALFSSLICGYVHGQVRLTIPTDRKIYLNPEGGNDQSAGTKESPLKTLHEAARRLNEANGKGEITIYLNEGIYGLDKTVTFHPVNWHFTRENRLTIRAVSLPDDSD